MKNIFFAFLILNVVNTFGQQEASNWYFGENAGISFNSSTGIVTVLNDGRINTREGCASISDTNGDLLFYTDGTTVYNRFHEVIMNGNGLFGDESSTQSAIVVPKPNDENIYYVFTVGSNQNDTGLNYSIVDISRNLSLGQVIQKNINLLPHCAEKISAVVKDCISGSIWIITLASENGDNKLNYNTFHAFVVSSNGVNATSVKSTFSININDARGYLKLSPSGKKLACANVQSGLYLFDFDAQTGHVNNPLPLQINNINDKPYGVEFSPNNQFLYITSSNDYFNINNGSENNNPLNHNSILLQYDLNAANISNSQIIIDSRHLYRGGLQLAPNGKIYRALSETYNSGLGYLSAINDPNQLGLASSYQHNAIELNGNNSTQGLPPFVTSFFNKNIDIIQNGSSDSFLPLCNNDIYTLIAEDIPMSTYVWTQDGVLLPDTDFDLEIKESGTYKVIIETIGGTSGNECGISQGEAIVKYYPDPIAFDAKLIQCDFDAIPDGRTTFNLNEANNLLTGWNTTDITITFYTSSIDANAGNDSGLILNSSSYNNKTNYETIYARIENPGGCYDTSILTLEVNTTQIDNFQALPVCDETDSPDGINIFSLNDFSPLILTGLSNTADLQVSYYENRDDAILEKNSILTDYTNTSPYSQVLYFRVEDKINNACFGISELLLTVIRLPELNENETSFYCLNFFPTPITLDAAVLNDSPNNYTYNWSTSENTYEVDINKSGIYTVMVTNINGCSKQRTITVEDSNIASFQSIDIIDASQNNTITVFVSGEGIYEYALYDENNILYSNYQESNVFENVFPGIYTITVRDIKNDCGTVPDKVSVIGFPKFFTPNNDGIHDTWQVYGVSGAFQPNSKIFIFDRFGKLIKQLSPFEEGWNGLFNGEKLPTDDYWFSVTLQDGRIFKSHFTLKY